MSAPAIQYSAPVISPEVPWETRRHLQLLYQKIANHTQAFQIQANQIAGIQTGSTTNTTIVEGGGGSGPTPPSTGFVGQGLTNDQSGETGYATAQGDNGILLILNDASPVAVSLTTTGAPFYLIITNFGAGTVTLTPSTGTVNGGASLSLLQNQTVYAACDSTNWHTTALPVAPQNAPAVTHEFLTAYDAATGAFSQAQPAYSDISGTPQLAITKAPVAHEWLASYDATTGNFTQTQPTVADVTGAAPVADPTFTGVVTQPDATVLTAATTTTSATAGAATALPATPAGYLTISLNGGSFKIPYFAA